jgi:endonuclease YncB( thermonuclease family)
MRRPRSARKTVLQNRRRNTPQSTPKGIMIGLGAFTVVFVSAVVLAYQAVPTSGSRHRDAEATSAPKKAAVPELPKSSSATAFPTGRAEQPGSSSAPHNERAQVRFQSCGEVRVNCIVDGDTFWFEGQKIRIADIDTPEISQPQCQQEYDQGMVAKDRLTQLLNAGPFELRVPDGRSQDGYGRQLRLVVRGGKSIGNQLVEEGLAHRWIGHKQPWC